MVLTALGFYQALWWSSVTYYRMRNANRSLEHAILREREWDKVKPKEEEYDDEDYGDEEGAEGGEAPAEEAAGDGEEEEMEE